jgi:hypothetical protein
MGIDNVGLAQAPCLLDFLLKIRYHVFNKAIHKTYRYIYISPLKPPWIFPLKPPFIRPRHPPFKILEHRSKSRGAPNCVRIHLSHRRVEVSLWKKEMGFHSHIGHDQNPSYISKYYINIYDIYICIYIYIVILIIINNNNNNNNDKNNTNNILRGFP